MIHAVTNCITEWSFSTGKVYQHPFREAVLDVAVTDPQGKERVLPAFWAGEQTWSVRYAPLTAGEYHYRTVCSDTGNLDLHGREGTVSVTEYQGDNALLRRGPLGVAASRRHLEHRDGTPFFWLADTWWMSLSKRLEWPDEFKRLTADRVQKGFSVIQIVAGLYPDMPAFDERGANEAGFPWDPEYSAINPAYFDMADLRLAWLVRSGLVPCIVGCWGYFLDFAGLDVIKQHWRNLVARYAAYPVVWCLAGEALMPYYLRTFADDGERERYRADLHAQWTEIARYVREIDPYGHPITIHPDCDLGSRQMVDADCLDLDILQTGHSDRSAMPVTIKLVTESYAATPTLPVLNSEVCYEGLGEACREEMQRFYFWSCVLSGACGHTYGANGIWQLNRREWPYGPSPHGSSQGDTPWDVAAELPGARQVALGKRLLERYEWWRFAPHQEWIQPHGTPEQPFLAYAAGIPEEVRVIYSPFPWWIPTVMGLEPSVAYRAFLFDPRNGQERDLGRVQPDKDSNWPFPGPVPVFQDWVLVLERIPAS